jgi:hypothetical protein
LFSLCRFAQDVAARLCLSAADCGSYFGDDGFAEQTTFSGEAAETGVLARQALALEPCVPFAVTVKDA